MEQAVWGYPWLVRDGHKLTSSEQAWNDGNRNRPESLGNAWQGCYADKVFAGITYDNKLGIAVTYRSGYWDQFGYQPGPNGYSVNQAAWVLDKLGWSDVINLSSDQNTKPVIYVNGQEVISLKKIVGEESVEPNVRYCIAIDVE